MGVAVDLTAGRALGLEIGSIILVFDRSLSGCVTDFSRVG